MRILTLLLFLQTAVPPQREIIGPFTFREDQGQTTKVILKNGLTVIAREQHAIPLVSITTHIKAGRFDEPDQALGISEVLSHLLVKGKPSEDMRALGGAVNASADGDRIVYTSVVPASNGLTALGVQANVLRHGAFDPDELKREVDEVLEEDAARDDSPTTLASQKLHESSFTVHRIKRPRVAAQDTLRALTADDVSSHYQRFYRPANSIITVVGAVDREKVLQEAVKLYADLEDIPVEREPLSAEPAQDAFRYTWRRGPIQQAHVRMGFHVPGILSEETRSLEVAAAILGEGRASRLNQILRDQKGLITSGSASLQAFSNFGYLELELVTPTPAEAATAILAEIAGVKRGVSAEALARAKLTIARDYYERNEDVARVSADLAYYEALGDWKRSSGYVDQIQRVTAQRVSDAAGKYLTFENLSVLEYLPESTQRYMSASEYRAAVLDKVEGAVERRNETELPVIQVPARSAVVTDSIGTIQRRSILRGPDVHILEDHRLPIVSFGLFFPGGRLMETDRNAGITELMLHSALRGAGSLSGTDIARRIENAGAQIEVVNEPDFFGYVLSGFPGRMDQALRVLVDVLQNPTFDEDQVSAQRTIQLAKIRGMKDDNTALPAKLFMQTLFADHPYGRPAAGTESGIEMLTGVQLRQWLRENMRKLLPTIVIVGDSSGTALVAPIADALTNEDLQPRDLNALPRIQPTLKTGESVESVGWGQSVLVYGFAAANRSSSERYAFDVIANILSGRSNLAAENIANSRGGALLASIAFSADKEADSRAKLEAEFARLRQDGVSTDELRSSIQYSVGTHDAALQTRESRVFEYARAIYGGSGVPSVAGYGAAMQAVTATQLKSVVERYMDPAGLRIAVARRQAQP